MATYYVRAAMQQARYEILADDGTYYAEIPKFQGVYANATTFEECHKELQEVLEEWIAFRVAKHLSLPDIDQ